jgi:peptidyl-prolyl cis-trans isomerase SurA
VTAPFGDANRISVLVLCGRDDPEAAGLPTATQVEERLREERVNRRAQRYLRDLRRDAVIEYR